jgi:hypothetical protein
VIKAAESLLARRAAVVQVDMVALALALARRTDVLVAATMTSTSGTQANWAQLAVTPSPLELFASVDDWKDHGYLRVRASNTLSCGLGLVALECEPLMLGCFALATGVLQPSTDACHTLEEYLETQYRLLRAECFLSFSQGVQSLSRRHRSVGGRTAGSSTSGVPSGALVYERVAIIALSIDRTGVTVSLRLPKKVRAGSTSFKHGNLIMVSNDRSCKHPVFATVVADSKDGDGSKSISEVNARVDLSSGDASVLHLLNLASSGGVLGSCVMLETPVYFHVNAPALQRLQALGRGDALVTPILEDLRMVRLVMPVVCAVATYRRDVAKYCTDARG